MHYIQQLIVTGNVQQHKSQVDKMSPKKTSTWIELQLALSLKKKWVHVKIDIWFFPMFVLTILDVYTLNHI